MTHVALQEAPDEVTPGAIVVEGVYGPRVVEVAHARVLRVACDVDHGAVRWQARLVVALGRHELEGGMGLEDARIVHLRELLEAPVRVEHVQPRRLGVVVHALRRVEGAVLVLAPLLE